MSSRHRNRMRTPKLRSLLPTFCQSAYIKARISLHKSLFPNILMFNSIVCRNLHTFPRICRKTRNFVGGGYSDSASSSQNGTAEAFECS